MASKSRRRRGGHPAKAAARRDRERDRREGPADPLRRAASTFVREAAELEDAFDAEQWGSLLLGLLWQRRELLDAEEAEVRYGEPLAAELARIGGEGGLAGLLAVAELAETRLSTTAREHADRLRAKGVRPPRWAQDIRAAEVLGVAVMREPFYDDGMTIFVEARHGDGKPHAVGIYIDNNLGGIAKDILLAESIARVREIVSAEDDPHQTSVEPLDPVEAALRIRDAIELTDTCLNAPVGEDFAALRALAVLRADELPGGPPVEIDEPEVGPEERDALHAAFLEEAGYAPGGDEAFVGTLAIDYASDFQAGGPLRWSPVVVELFMTGFLAQKVVADRTAFEAVPAALDAWVRFAGRRRGIPEWAIERTAAAIPQWTDAMLAALDGPRGTGAELVAAALEAGVDLTDSDALAAFVAGWNARSDAD